MSNLNGLRTASDYQVIYFNSSLWLPVYTSFCILGSMPFLVLTIRLGISVADDVVFGALVIVGGTLGDFAFRIVFHRIMFLIRSIQAIWAWPFIGGLVMILQPLD